MDSYDAQNEEQYVQFYNTSVQYPTSNTVAPVPVIHTDQLPCPTPLTYTPLRPRNNNNNNENRSFCQHENFERKVLQELNEIRNSITQYNEKVISLLQKINEKLDVRQSTDDNIFEIPEGFPLQRIEDFQTFENAQQSRLDALQRHLEFVGGQTLKDALHNFIRVTMSSDLATKFSWTGRSIGSERKVSLCNTKLMRIFLRTARKLGRVQQFTKEEFICNMKDVLRSYKQISRNAQNATVRVRQRIREEERSLFDGVDVDEQGDYTNVEND